MDTTATQTIITNALTDYGVAVLAILTAILTLGVAYLVFRFGWKKTKASLDGGMVFRDDMERQAYNRGLALNKRDGLLQD